MPNIGPMELIVVLIIALLILGPKRLPAAGRSLGHGTLEFTRGSGAGGAGGSGRVSRTPALLYSHPTGAPRRQHPPSIEAAPNIDPARPSTLESLPPTALASSRRGERA